MKRCLLIHGTLEILRPVSQWVAILKHKKKDWLVFSAFSNCLKMFPESSRFAKGTVWTFLDLQITLKVQGNCSFLLNSIANDWPVKFWTRSFFFFPGTGIEALRYWRMVPKCPFICFSLLKKFFIFCVRNVHRGKWG